jgi:transcription elongation GreA/GreB family factor|tara:strand:- start:295 stop:528 length:234 start_codon:yes stop_codon:yes gene_type:complete
MKEYKIKRHIPHIVRPSNVEECKDRIVSIDEKKSISGDIARKKEMKTELRFAEIEERLRRVELINDSKEIQDGGEEG